MTPFKKPLRYYIQDQTFKKCNLEIAVFTIYFVFLRSFSPDTGHYTAMLWADTHRLGCGFLAFLNPDNVGWYTKHFVCNYGPAGNRLGASLYKVGPAGTGCEQQDIAYPALCAS